MAEYKLANGSVLTDADIELVCKELEGESRAGRLERIHRGPAAVADEPLVTVPVKFPRSMVAAIDAKGSNRSDFIRKAVAAALRRPFRARRPEALEEDAGNVPGT